MINVNLEIVFRFFVCVVILIGAFGCCTFLYRSRRLKKTNFVRYCICLVISDIIISICFLFNLSGINKAIGSALYNEM